MTGSRNYPVPRAIAASARLGASTAPLHYDAISAARGGQVRGHHLPTLASASARWTEGSEWASGVLTRERDAEARKQQSLLAAIGYDPDSYTYHALIDPSQPDIELLTSVIRTPDADGPLEGWDGDGWSGFDLGDDDAVYAVLDEGTLAALLEALGGGSGGIILRPTEPRAWIPGQAPNPIDQYSVVSAGPPPRQTGAMVALYPDPDTADAMSVDGGESPDDIHLTLAYLGDTADPDTDIDYQALQRAVAKWASLYRGPLDGEVSGKGVFTAGDKPVTYASADIPALPQAREMLMRILESEGISVNSEHGYTPHMTIAYDDLGDDYSPDNHPLSFGSVVAKYGDDTREYPLGGAVTAAGGAGPDTIYAVVDEFDTSAVLDLLRVSPGPTAYRRVNGAWAPDRDMLEKLVGVDPPPVVEVSPAQAADVIAQVDAYDAQHPEKTAARVAAMTAGIWDENKYARNHGKFASKGGGSDGSSSGSGGSGGGASGPGGGAAGPGNRLAPYRPGTGTGNPVPSGAYHPPPPAHPGHRGGPGGPGKHGGPGGPGAGPNHGGPAGKYGPNSLPPSVAASGVGQDFFAKQPPGFEKWLDTFLKSQAQQQAAAKTSATKKTAAKTSNSNPNDPASKAARAKASAAAKKAAATRKANGTQPSWWAQVPPQFRAAMKEFLAEAGKSGAGPSSHEQALQRRIDAADGHDRKFDLGFAKQGLGEARRREMFDRQILGLRQRLSSAGADPGAIARVLAAKAAQEKQARDDFARQRRMAVDQERVRRMAARDAEKDQQVAERRATVTAAVSTMPTKLKRYWTAGEGGAKIRWGVGGDYDRCLKQLIRYVPEHMVHGACASLHHLAVGSWPGKGRSH